MVDSVTFFFLLDSHNGGISSHMEVGSTGMPNSIYNFYITLVYICRGRVQYAERTPFLGFISTAIL